MSCRFTGRPPDRQHQGSQHVPAGATHIHLDPLGGISGDMFIAALLDAWPEAGDGLETAMRAAGLPAEWTIESAPGRDGPLTGRRFAIRPPAAGKSRPTGHYAGIVARLEAAPLEAPVRDRAIAILTHLAEAEAEVHGIAVAEVHFHEIADWDSIADVVGAAWLIDRLGAAGWSVGPLPLGSGRVATAHGASAAPVHRPRHDVAPRPGRRRAGPARTGQRARKPNVRRVDGSAWCRKDHTSALGLARGRMASREKNDHAGTASVSGTGCGPSNGIDNQ